MRVAVAYRVAAGLGLILLGVAPAAAELRIDRTVDYYDVTGTTAQEVRANLDRIGPSWPLDGKRYDSSLRWHFRWEYRFAPGERGCQMTHVTVVLRLITTSPRLKVGAATPPALQKAFAAYTEKLGAYDQQRAAMVIEAGKRIEDGITGLPPERDCRDLKPVANHLADNIQREISRLMHDYVRRTDAGRAQGAVFPAPDSKAAGAGPRRKK